MLIKKIVPMNFKFFSTDIVTIYQETCITFLHFLAPQIIINYYLTQLLNTYI